MRRFVIASLICCFMLVASTTFGQVIVRSCPCPPTQVVVTPQYYVMPGPVYSAPSTVYYYYYPRPTYFYAAPPAVRSRGLNILGIPIIEFRREN